MMDKRLVNTLLSIFHSPDNKFKDGKTIRSFCSEYSLGRAQGASIFISEADKQEIGRILIGEMGIDPARTTSEAWKNLDRAQSLALARNEKFAGRTVGSGRLRLKTLPGRTLQIAGSGWNLPLRSDLGLDLEAVLDHNIGHDSLLIVENLLVFDDIHKVDASVMKSFPANEPLVVFRGDAQGGARTDAVHSLIGSTTLPVFAFVDYDPAGMIIASGLPRLNKVLSPPLPELEAIIRSHGIAERYLEQIPAASHALEKLKNDALLSPVWKVIQAAGKGLPQEYFTIDPMRLDPSAQ